MSARRSAFFARRRRPRLRSSRARSDVADMRAPLGAHTVARAAGRGSGVREAHAGLAVAIARSCAGRQRLVDPREVGGGEPYADGARVVLEILAALRTRDRRDEVALRQQPRERELTRRTSLVGSDHLDAVDQPKVALEVLAREARCRVAEVVRAEVVEALDLAGQEPAPERAVRHEAHAELAARLEDAA